MDTALPDAPLAVHLRGMVKRFGAVTANDAVTLQVRSGSVHGLVGENGAGKSTLMSILYGFYRADAGQIEVFGRPVEIHNANDAIALGLGMVHQHFMLVDSLSALDNVMLGAEPHWLLQRAAATVRSRLLDLMQSTGLQVALDTLVADMTVGERQRLEILKTLFRGARVLILDEPTAVLTPQETEQLFGVLRQLRAMGTTIILITHKLKEVLALCDVVTVMRAGRVVAEHAVQDVTAASLAEAMVGRKLNLARQDAPAATGASPARTPVLSIQDVALHDALGVQRLRDFHLQLYPGEIVGVAGVDGNGQGELLAVLSGMQCPTSGQMQLGTHAFAAPHWPDPRQARSLGIAHVPQDRQARALVMPLPAWESAVLGYEALPQYGRWGWLVHRRMRAATRAMMERFDVRPPNPELRSSQFSGGNQQKLVLARELGQEPQVLLVGQPTRGVDIGAIEFIYGQLRALRARGCAILLVSSELDEILALSDRVLVLHQGRISGELPIAECTQARLGLLMTVGAPA